MSSDLENRVWQLSLAHVPKLVLLRFASVADADGRHAFRSIASVATDCGLCQRSVGRIVRDLVGDRVMVRQEATRGRGHLVHWKLDLQRAVVLYGVAELGKKPKRPGAGSAQRGHEAWLL